MLDLSPFFFEAIKSDLLFNDGLKGVSMHSILLDYFSILVDENSLCELLTWILLDWMIGWNFFISFTGSPKVF